MFEYGSRPPRPNQVTVAGIGLIAGSGVETLVCAVTATAAIYDTARYHALHGAVSIALPVLGVAAGVLAVLGGVHLLRGSNKTLAYVGAIASLIPGTLCCVLGGAFGILALVLLPRNETRAHFGESVPPPTPYWPPTGTPADPTLAPPYPGPDSPPHIPHNDTPPT